MTLEILSLAIGALISIAVLSLRAIERRMAAKRWAKVDDAAPADAR